MFVSPVLLHPLYTLQPPMELKHCYLHPPAPKSFIVTCLTVMIPLWKSFVFKTAFLPCLLLCLLVTSAFLSWVTVFCLRHAPNACRDCRQLVPVLEGFSLLRKLLSGVICREKRLHTYWKIWKSHVWWVFSPAGSNLRQVSACDVNCLWKKRAQGLLISQFFTLLPYAVMCMSSITWVMVPCQTACFQQGHL